MVLPLIEKVAGNANKNAFGTLSWPLEEFAWTVKFVQPHNKFRPKGSQILIERLPIVDQELDFDTTVPKKMKTNIYINILIILQLEKPDTYGLFQVLFGHINILGLSFEKCT